ncbi:MAG: surface lipoprotein assembly modifier [Formosimonas sp.]
MPRKLFILPLVITFNAHAQTPPPFDPQPPRVLERATVLPQPEASLPAAVVAPTAAAPASAESSSTSIDALVSQPELFTQVLTQMIINGQLAAVEKSLPYYEKVTKRDETIYRYARGLVARSHGRWASAIKDFRSILADAPQYTGVRLDLATTLMMSGADESATYHFEQALADTKLSPATRSMVEASLAQLAKRRSWSVSAGASALYDANVNNASSAEYVTIWGLPFKKNAESMPQKARGWQASVDASQLFTLHDRHKLRVGLSLSSKDYNLNAYDAQDGRVDAGYVWNDGLSSIYAGLYGTGRVLDRKVSERNLGVRVAGSRYLSPRWSVNGSYDYVRNRYPSYARLNGHAQTVSVGANYALKPTMNLSAGVDYTHRRATDESLSRNEWSGRLGFGQDLRFGVSYNVALRYTRSRYDGEAPFFGGTRRDQEWSPQVTLAWRKLNFYGFIPRLTVGYTKHTSNLAMYEFKKWSSFVTVDKRF